MNTFDPDIEQLDSDELKAALSVCTIEALPNAPSILSKKECAIILGVSMKVINKLIDTGQLSLVDLPDDDYPESYDLFGQAINQPKIGCILRADLVDFLEKSLYCHKPIL